MKKSKNCPWKNSLKNLNDDIFVKQVAHFLMALENNYGDVIKKEVLKKWFSKNYDSIIKYLRSGSKGGKHFITEENGGWRINNLNLDKVQKFILRLVQEDAILEQSKILKHTRNAYWIIAVFTFFLMVATVIIALE